MLKGQKHSEEAKRKNREAHLGKKGWSSGKKRPEMQGEKHPQWKGDKVGYSGLHMWVRDQLGTPSYCAYCQTTNAKKFEWANISHAYKRELSDWIRLCVSCHHLYDRNKIKLWN